MPAADPIALLLAGRYPDPETGELLACESRAIAIEDSLVGREVELVASVGVGPRLAVISDVDTFAALGDRVERALAARYTVQHVMLPRHPHADVETIAKLLDLVEPGADAIVAVGSGTLNDLAKMVALQRDVPQLVFATAPSMNGYTSVSASITEGGFKRSVRARTPVGVFLDLSVLAAAPVRLIRAGLGDSVCRPTAQADWLLAHLLLDRPYREVPFALLAADEAVLFAEAGGLVRGDLGAIRALARTLVLSGFGMTACGGSFPASQGEHMIGHYLEMMRPAEVPEAFHGEQIGVTAVAMARIQEEVLARETPPVMRPTTLTREEVIAHFGPAIGEPAWRDFATKVLDPDRAAALTARLAASWPAMRARIGAVTTTAAKIASILTAAGAPATPAELGYPDALVDAAIAHAREIRDRYTFLDFVGDS